jgi:hypothetical protein
MIGAGVTFSGADVSATDLHGMAGVAVRFPGVLGVRVDGMATGVPQSHLRALSADLMLHATTDPERPVQPYLLAGGTLFFPVGSTERGVNAGLGARLQLGPQRRPKGGVFVEGRYLRIFDYNTQRDDLLLATAGLSVQL